MDNAAVRLLKERYFTYCVGFGIMVAAISPLAERNDYHRLLMGFAVGALVVNLAAAMWAFTPTRVIEENCKLRVFKSVFYSTGIVSPYAAACVLLPEKFAPYLVLMMIPLICVVTTLYNFFLDEIISGLKWVCVKAANGWRWIGSKFTRDAPILPVTIAATRSSST